MATIGIDVSKAKLEPKYLEVVQNHGAKKVLDVLELVQSETLLEFMGQKHLDQSLINMIKR